MYGSEGPAKPWGPANTRMAPTKEFATCFNKGLDYVKETI